MNQKQKDIIIVNDHKTVKILNKKFTKKILDCFHNESKTASEIANSISFPKEKIYYHIKNLVSNDILFVAKTKKIQGIEQKFFFPTAKNFQTGKNNNIKKFGASQDQNPNKILDAPITTPVRRLNETKANREIDVNYFLTIDEK